jgi:RHS repeat-associated protein
VLMKHPDADLYRFGYQGQFAERDTVTQWSHFQLREYDARLGRWLVPDPYREFYSPYLAMGNNPINTIDPDGGCTDQACIEALADQFAVTATRLYDGVIDVEFDEMATNLSFSEYQIKYPEFIGMSPAQAKEHWESNYGADYRSNWAEQVKRERAMVVVGKLKWFAMAYTYVGGFALGAARPVTLPQVNTYSVTPRGVGLTYNPRVNAPTDLYHNYPKIFDKTIINEGAPSLRLVDRARWFEMPGSINGTNGNFQIGINNNNNPLCD